MPAELRYHCQRTFNIKRKLSDCRPWWWWLLTIVGGYEYTCVYSGVVLYERVGEPVAGLLCLVDGIHVVAEVDRVLNQQRQTLLQLQLIQDELQRLT